MSTNENIQKAVEKTKAAVEQTQKAQPRQKRHKKIILKERGCRLVETLDETGKHPHYTLESENFNGKSLGTDREKAIVLFRQLVVQAVR